MIQLFCSILQVIVQTRTKMNLSQLIYICKTNREFANEMRTQKHTQKHTHRMISVQSGTNVIQKRVKTKSMEEEMHAKTERQIRNGAFFCMRNEARVFISWALYLKRFGVLDSL